MNVIARTNVAASPAPGRRPWGIWRDWTCLGWPGILLLGLWANYNSGPWWLRHFPGSATAAVHAGRATLALVVPVLAAFVYVRRARMLRDTSPAHVWMAYACLVVLGGILFGRDLFTVLYWSAAYAGAFLAASACIREGRELADAVAVNRVTWLVVSVLVSVLCVVARDVLVVGEGLGASGYGVLGRMPEVGGMVMSRSTGMARFGAVPGLVALGLLLHRRGAGRMAGLAVYLLVAVFLYIMQGRGATAGFIGATFFMLLCAGRAGRATSAVLIVAVAAAAVLNAIPSEFIDHLTRGQSVDQLRSMSGRDRAWGEAWEVIAANPIFGYGFEADRWLIGEHVHNTYMYALVAAGFPGLGLFAAGLVWSWLQFAQALRHPALAASGQKMTLVQVGGVLAFFTLRGIPEVCGSNYAADYLIMLPAILYVHVLWRHLRTAQAGLWHPI